MKKIISLVFISLVLIGCSSTLKTDDKSLVIGASITPHAEILNLIKPDLEAKGYTVEIKEFTDYVQPNIALHDKSLDANYFQHQPYLDEFNAERKWDLQGVAVIHYEPFGIYPGKTKSLAELQDGAQIAVPNDTTNEARALLLLEANGLIKLKENVGLKATKQDIVENPNNFDIVELEAAQLSKSLVDVDLAVINGNYALQANLTVEKDAIAFEDIESFGSKTYGNVIATRSDNKDSQKIKDLIEALQSQKVKDFIQNTYKGGVQPSF